MDLLLGIDLGTSGTKTVLFDPCGTPVASHTVEYPLHQPHNGWAEQDPHDWWRAVQETVQAVLAKSGAAPADIKGVGISGQMHGLVAWARAEEDIPCFGTTHADYFYGPIPCARHLTQTELEEDYEKNTGKIILETFRERYIEPSAVPAPQRYQDKHYFRKHGPNAYYGQGYQDLRNAELWYFRCDCAGAGR